MDEIFLYVMNIAHSATSYTTSLKTHLVNPLKQYATSQPDLMNIALLLVIVYLSLAILGMASRWIYSVVITTLRLLLFVAVVGGGAGGMGGAGTGFERQRYEY